MFKILSSTNSKRLSHLLLAASSAAGLLLLNNHVSKTPIECAQNEDFHINPSLISKYGLPTSQESTKFRDGYVVSYNRKHKTANWTCEYLNKYSIQGNKVASRKGTEFVEDTSDPEVFRAKLNDYRGSGYDRGHLACAANHSYNQHAMQDTFFLSNMSPQVGKGFNRDIWNRLEMYTRSLVNTYEHVYVCTGPLYLPKFQEGNKRFLKHEVIGANSVSVPTDFFKVIIAERSNGVIEIQCFILPNTELPPDEPLAKYVVRLEIVESLSGFLFFSAIKDKYLKQTMPPPSAKA